MTSLIDADWITRISPELLKRVLCEFRYYFRRFTPGLALVIGNAENQFVRQLLMPNLIEECGSRDGESSHLDLLDSLLNSCGIPEPSRSERYPTTVTAEQWFFDLYRGDNTLASLCALGPATESISGCFLLPLQDAVSRQFVSADLDMRYFEVHLCEMEREHVEAIAKAICVLRKQSNISDEEVQCHISNAIHRHKLFWDGLKKKSSCE